MRPERQSKQKGGVQEGFFKYSAEKHKKENMRRGIL